ncbi:hypothetical protein VC596_09040 [Citrobacter freundii]|uniref:hypothetical protein n=1 Tax=Citrobacter freundii TaxID=546 RepID=UPI00292B19DF|nr:hypothetical protein [Citrobacter freundii]MDV1214346.1 hypothetical protein [Citrobacter freundii]MEB0452779.1 hypothetical protein [Citrobacter freundii]
MTKITERGMIFNAEMVRAILDGRKTQTRRVVKFKPREPGFNLNFSGLKLGHYRTGDASSGYVLASRGAMGCWNDKTFPAHCPYGQPGDRIWVRETFRVHSRATDLATLVYKASERQSWTEQTHRVPVSVCNKPAVIEKWTPSIHMPRWASRILLDITDVRVERLNSISQADSIAEGAPPSHPSIDVVSRQFGYPDFSRSWFGQTWQSIYGDDSWQANPWVWVIEFKRIEGAGHATD